MQNWREFLDGREMLELKLVEYRIRMIDGYRANLAQRHRNIVDCGLARGRQVRFKSHIAQSLREEITAQEIARKLQINKRRVIQQRAAERARYATRNEVAA